MDYNIYATYNDARPAIQTGDVVFIKGSSRNIVDRATMFLTSSEFSHVGIAVWLYDNNNNGRLLLIDSHALYGRRMINMSRYAECDMDIISAPKPWSEVGEEVMSKVGKVKYNWIQALYVGIREFLLMRELITLPDLQFSGEICSEYVARTFQLPIYNISPQKLLEQFNACGHKPKMVVRKIPTTIFPQFGQ